MRASDERAREENLIRFISTVVDAKNQPIVEQLERIAVQLELLNQRTDHDQSEAREA